MTTEKIKSSSEVLTDFLGEQAEDDTLDQGTVSAICDLRVDGKLTKTNILRRLEEARTKVLKDDHASQEDLVDD